MPFTEGLGHRAGQASGPHLYTAAGQILYSAASGRTAASATLATGQIPEWNATGIVGAYPSSIVAYCGQQSGISVGTGELTLLSGGTLSIPARMAAGDKLEVDVSFTLLNNSAASRVYTPRLLLGSTNIFNIAIGTAAASATARRCFLKADIEFTAVAAQRWSTVVSVSGAATPFLPWTLGGHDQGTSTEDFTASKALDFLMTSAAGTATQTVQVEFCQVKHVPLKAA